MRVGLGYDDVVGYDSGAYKVGQAAGTAVSVATAFANPCAVGGLAGNALRGLNAVQGAASAFDAGEAFGKGDAVGGMMALAGARASFASMLKACFAAGTPILTPTGSTPIESLVAGDLVLSRDEFDLGAPVAARRVLQAFARVSPVVEVLVEGRAVVTTGEHPFWVAGTGWTPAGQLAAGDVLVSHDGQELPVTAVRDAGRVASVYNVEVERDHTYFVGTEAWGFSLWAHNKCEGLHHLWPVSLGNGIPYGSKFLTHLSKTDHTAIHAAMSVFMRAQTKTVGGKVVTMLTGPGNPGARVVRNFTFMERFEAVLTFHQNFRGGAFLKSFLAEAANASKGGKLR